MYTKSQSSLTVIALLALVPSIATAQSSITLYGRADTAIYHQTRSNPSSNQWSLSSDTSYFGIRGQEDLGGGLSTVFKLESQVDLSTGSSSASAFFNREAYVGLTDRQLGTVILGSMWGPSVWISGKADAFGRAQLGAVQTMLQGAANRGNTFQFNNAVQYVTPKIGNMVGRVYIGMPEGAVAKNYAGSVDYSKGPLFVGLSFDSAQVTGGSVGSTRPVVRAKTLGIGASYNFGPAKLFGYAQQNRIPGLSHATSLNASLAVPVGAGEIRFAIGKWNRPLDADAKRIAIGYTHHLSKRTQIYGVAAKLNNSARSTTMLFPVNQDSSAAIPGQDVSAFGIGMRHMF